MLSSLEKKCRVPALLALLNHPHVKKEIFRLPINDHNLDERNVDLQRAVSEVLKNLNPVLKGLTPTHLALLIGFEMRTLAERLKEYFDLSFEFSEKFIKTSFFTPGGLIDEEKAIRELLKLQSLTTLLKFKIACHYFLADAVERLWQTLRKNDLNFSKIFEGEKLLTSMVMWFYYLENKNSTTTVKQRELTREFKIRVFSYGLKHKNLSAVKFALGSEDRLRDSKTEAKIIRELVYITFRDYLSTVLKDLQYKLAKNSAFHIEIINDLSIVSNFFSLMSKQELKIFIFKNRFSDNILNLFLFWPFQNQFMDIAYLVFENLDGYEYCKLLYQIVVLSDDQYLGQSYNYRNLLREFWVKSPPHLKQEFIGLESDSLLSDRIISRLFKVTNFTSDDLAIFGLFLENANSRDKENILQFQGEDICRHSIIDNGNFKLADLFLNSQNFNQDTLETFKKNFLINYFFILMKKQDINFVEEIFKWVVGSDEIDDFKREFFNRLIHSSKIEHLFIKLKEKIPYFFLNKILKWSLKTDENIEEWKKSIVYSPLIRYENFIWFDLFLQYRGFSFEEAKAIKRDLLLEKLPEIAKHLLEHECDNRAFRALLMLCSFEMEKATEFTDCLRSFYEDSMKQKMCLFCLNNNYVHSNGDGMQSCELHGTRGFLSLEKLDEICTIFLNTAEYLILTWGL